MTDPRPAADPGMAFPAAALMESWFRAGRQMIELGGRLSARMITFLGERMEADLRFGRRLAECRDVAAMTRLQGEWLQETLEHYRRELQASAEELWNGFKAMREEAAEATGAAEAGSEAKTSARERRAAA